MSFLRRLSYQTWISVVVGLVVIGVSTRVLFQTYFFSVHDYTQGARVVEMFSGFQEGQIPVRWSKNFGFGYGMPAFLFYAPFPYYIGAFFYWISKDVVLSLKFIWGIPSLLSFVGMYLFTKKHFGRLGALVAATSFTLAPYRALDLYIRGAVGEIWAIAFFPWVLWSIDRWCIHRKKVDINVIAWTTFLFLSHNLMTMFFIPVIAFYILLKWLLQQKRKLIDLAWSYLQIFLSFGCAAFYLLPAFLEKNYTQYEKIILGGYFDYNLHFLYLRQFFYENWKYGGSTWGVEDDLSFFLGYGQLLGVGLFVGLLFWILIGLLQKKTSLINTLREFFRHPVLILALIGLPASMLFATQKTKFVWDAVSVLQTAQFPWRFLSLSIFFIAILNGFVFTWKTPSKVRFATAAILMIVLILPAFKYFRPEKYLSDHGNYYDDPHRIRFEMSETWPDFLPKEFNAQLEPTDQRFHIVNNPEAEKTVEVLVDRSHQLLVRTNFASPTTVTFHIANFPGWRAFLRNEAVEFQQSSDGLIEVNVPAGDQLVGLDFQQTPIRMFADSVTALSLFILIASQIKIGMAKKGAHD